MATKLDVSREGGKYQVFEIAYEEGKGFRNARLQTVEQLPKDLGVDPRKNSMRLGITRTSTGEVDIIGLNRAIGGEELAIFGSGRCTLSV